MAWNKPGRHSGSQGLAFWFLVNPYGYLEKKVPL